MRFHCSLACLKFNSNPSRRPVRLRYATVYCGRDNLLRSSELARAQFDTIRLRLLKIGTRIEVGKTFMNRSG